MKLVIGIIRPERANDVLEALYRANVRGVSMSRVQGHGGELDRVETYRGTRVKMELFFFYFIFLFLFLLFFLYTSLPHTHAFDEPRSGPRGEIDRVENTRTA